MDGVIVQQPSGLRPAGLGVDSAGWAVPSGSGELQAGQLLPLCPAHKVPGIAAVAGLVAGQPCVEVCLAGVGQGAAAGAEPFEQRDGGADVAFHGDQLGVGGVSAVVALPQPVQQVPDGVAVQQLPLPGIVAFGEGACDPAFEAGQVFIAGRQGTGGDQDGAQVLDRFAGRELIERGMAECPLAGAEFAKELSDDGLVQPLPARGWGDRCWPGCRAGRAARRGRRRHDRRAGPAAVAAGCSGCRIAC